MPAERAATHYYVSTACMHDEHASCRGVCKFCDAPCQCGVCAAAGSHPPPPAKSQVDQARDIARALLGACPVMYLPPEAMTTWRDNPALHWLWEEPPV